MNFKKIFILGALSLVAANGFAQTDGGKKKKDWGSLSGSFETNTIYYVKDSEVPNQKMPKHDVGSNNYLKADYVKGRFSAGIQAEGYFDALYGFEQIADYHQINLTNFYVQWADKNYSITGGTFYDQFGSGLLFRAFEDRALGVNNALLGARVTYNFKNILALKGLWGKPRFGMNYNTDAQLWGFDASFRLSELWHAERSSLSVEGSFLNRYEKVRPADRNDVESNTQGWSGRLNYEIGGFMAKAEYVDNGDNYWRGLGEIRHGNAQQLELGYSGNGLGIMLTGRRLEWMYSRFDMYNTLSGNIYNYIPAQSLQHTYALANMHPYSPETGRPGSLIKDVPGELGGQVDVYYHVKRGTALGGKRGMKLHANFTTYYGLQGGGGALRTGELLLREFTFDLEKQFNRKFKMNLFYSNQEWNVVHGEYLKTQLSHVIVGDFLYKWTPKFSTRLELQYLISNEVYPELGTEIRPSAKDWMAALLEVSFAPKWTIYVSDMYNHGNPDPQYRIHYYSAGASFTHSFLRLQFSYGRNREGYVCSGGVCRKQPTYTGANLMMTLSF